MSHITNKSFALLSKFVNNTRLLNNSKSLLKNVHTSNAIFANVSFNLSDIGEGIKEVVVKEWYVKVGDTVAQFDNICEVQSDKASVTITSRYDGTISKLYYKIDDIALVGKPLLDVDTTDETGPIIEKEELPKDVIESAPIPVAQAEHLESSASEIALCIPSVRRLARENKINLSLIKGTGRNGRILKEDVLEYLKTPQGTPLQSSEDRIEPIKGFQKAMVKTMNESLKIPHFVYSDEIKVTQISKLRRSLKNLPELGELKLSFMPFFIKAASNALQRYPIINARVDENCENIIYKRHHNIGIAMDTKIGLAVPVIKNVETLTVIEIAKELARLIASGKSGSFKPSDLSDGTFSISNIGIIGGTYTKPVILPPQVAIIALGAAQLLPRFDADKNVVAEEILNLSAAADHRIIDGASMAKFTELIKKQIENPNLLFLNL